MDPYAQEFYKKCWQQPGRQLIKKLLPLFIVIGGVGVLMLCLFIGIPYLFTPSDINMTIISHILLAVILSASITGIGHFLSIKRQSQFHLIRIPVRHKETPCDQ